MGVVLNGEAEVSLLRIAGAFQNILTGSHQLDHSQRQIGKVVRIRSFALHQELIQRLGVRFGWQVFTLLGCKLHDSVPTLGRFYHAPDGRHLQ